jgi:hypothetical protein
MMPRCQKLVTNRSESAHYSSHFFAATLVSFWLTLYQTNAQSRETAFGQIRTTVVPSKVDRFAMSAMSGDYPLLFFWSQRGSVITSATFDSSRTPRDWMDHYLKTPIDDFLVANFPFERKRVGVGIDRVNHLLAFYANLAADTLRAMSVVRLPVTPEGIVFGDLNGDKRTDFVVFDRESPGAFPYFGSGYEKFRQGKPIAPDNAIGGMKLVHLNNDSLIDIVFYDWVRSEVHLLYGVGQGKFLDQANFAIDGEVRDFVVAPLTLKGNLDIILACRQPSKLEILQGDGLGDFKIRQRIALKEPLVSIAVDDVNNDGYLDIVGIDGSSVLRAFLNGGDNTFDDRLDFVGGREVDQFVLHRGGQEGLADAFLLDKASQQFVTLSNGQHTIRLADSIDLSTGIRPHGVAIADLNGDSSNDVTLVTGGSNSISFYFNDGGSGFFGQTGYSLPASPHDVAVHSLGDSVARILISYPESKQVSLFTLDEREHTSTNATIGTERSVEFLYWDGLRKPAIDFFSFSPPLPSVPASLTLFQEIGSHQFIEQNFRLLPSNTLLGAGVGRLNDDAIPDVAFVYRNNSSGKSELAVSLGDSVNTYKQKSFSIELADKIFARSYVWVVDLDRKGHSDIVILQTGPTSILQRLRWVRDNMFSRPDTIAVGLRIADGSQLTFSDVDRDGLIDVVLNSAHESAIGWLRAKRSSFDGFRPLCSVPARSHFSIGDLNGDGIPDIAVTLSDSGILRIYDGKSLIRKSLENIR